jgi:Kef-type K+ transport system membrane component KefB
MDHLPIPTLLVTLAAILLAAKLLGDLAERIGQPAVLGELVAGVLLGPSLLGVVPTSGSLADVLHVVAELGVILLLFEIGLETDLREMFRVGPAALAVAAVGVVVPFVLGYAYWTAGGPGVPAGSGSTAAIFIGATLTATSVGITARVLSDLNRMSSREARIILGAAVIDDVLGLVILTVVTGVAAGTAVSLVGVTRVLAVAVGFLVAAVVLGRLLAPRLFELADGMRVRGVLVAAAVAVALGLAGLAELAGSAHILGAFAAGLILSGVNQFDTIERELKPVVSIFAPIFFVVVGASVDLRLLDPSREGAGSLLVLTLLLGVIAIVGKVVAGWAAPWERYRRLVVGVGMVPRGEVGLIFANLGLRSGVISDAVFSAVLLVVMISTFVAPPALKALFSNEGSHAAP